MNATDFAPIAADIQSRWASFKIPRTALAQFVIDLSDLRAEDVAVAVASLCNDGLLRPPTPGQVRRRVVELQIDAPAWPEARAALVRWRGGSEARLATAEAWACPAGVCDGSGFVIDAAVNDARDCECRPLLAAKRRGLDELPVLVAEFVGVDGQLSGAEVDALIEGDTQLDAQVRGRWEQFVRRIVDSRMLAALPPSVVLPRIEAARREDEARDGGLRRMNPVALLERGR